MKDELRFILTKDIYSDLWDLDSLPLLEVSDVTREESTAIEQNEFEDGVSAYYLMKKAGESIFNYISELNLNPKPKLAIICGPGNNGGDGIEAAKLLKKKFETTLILIKEPHKEEAKEAFDAFKSIYKDDFITSSDINQISGYLDNVDIIVDSIFGVSLKSKVKKPYDSILNYFTSANGKIIISVDLPSGLDCNTGEWYGPEFKPNAIICMQHIKKGVSKLTDDIKIIRADITISKKSEYYITKNHLAQFWPRRELESHKGDNGRLMVIGGSDEFTGAPVLAGMATLRCGVDTLRIAVPETIRDIVAGYAKDFIVVKVAGSRITSKAFKKFHDLTFNRHDVIVMGMGMSNHPDTIKFVLEIFSEFKNSIRWVLDAEAIRAFKGNLNLLKNTNVIITPHKAELRMMTGEAIPENLNDLIEFLQLKAKELGITILLKGRTDIITDGKRTYLNATGHPGMTVGGTGDVLAGVVGSAFCFIKDPVIAAAIGSYIMGKSGEYAGKKYGYGLLASDCIEEITNVLLNVN